MINACLQDPYAAETGDTARQDIRAPTMGSTVLLLELAVVANSVVRLKTHAVPSAFPRAPFAVQTGIIARQDIHVPTMD